MFTATLRAALSCGAQVMVCCAITVLCAACDSDSSKDGAPERVHDAAASRSSPRDAATAEPKDASAARDDASTLPSKPAACAHPPIPDGELQNMARGPSVFGKVVGGTLGTFDTFGDSECGIAAVRICVRGTELCTESDLAGQFVLSDLPTDVELEISFAKPGFRSFLRLAQQTSVPINLGDTRIVTRASAEEQLASVGQSPDPAMGAIVSVALAPGEGIGGVILPEHVTMTLLPGGRTPFYSAGEIKPGGLSSDELDRELTSTRPGGWGLFFNVPPGDYAIRYERDGVPCGQSLPGYGYGLDDDGNVKLRVVAGFNTGAVAAFCP